MEPPKAQMCDADHRRARRGLLYRRQQDTHVGRRGTRHDLDIGPRGRRALHRPRHAHCAVVNLHSGLRRAPLAAPTAKRSSKGRPMRFCTRFERVPRCIVLDIDDTDDAVHGQQQLALFNTHAGGYCFQPIQIFEATTGRPVLSLLRPGKRSSGEEVEQILRHVIGRIRRNSPAVEIMVRGDSHFATPEVMDLLEEKRCGYIFGLSTNPRLTEIGRPWSEDVAIRRALSKTEKMRRFFQTSYAAASW